MHLWVWVGRHRTVANGSCMAREARWQGRQFRLLPNRQHVDFCVCFMRRTPWHVQADAAAPCVALSGLSVGCSTERATAGRKRAPVRLAALLVDAEGQALDVAPVLSPEFYVSADGPCCFER